MTDPTSGRPLSRRQAKHRPATERMDEIRACVRLGTHDVPAIAYAMGVSKELVFLYAKRMDDVELRQARGERNRRVQQLYLREGAE